MMERCLQNSEGIWFSRQKSIPAKFPIECDSRRETFQACEAQFTSQAPFLGNNQKCASAEQQPRKTWNPKTGNPA